MRKFVLTFGFIGGAIMSVMMLITMPFQHQIGSSAAMVIGYTTMVMAFLMVFFGVRSYRDQAGMGRIGFGRALLVGLLIAIIASFCYVATWEVLNFFVYPDFADTYAAHTIEQARQSGASAAQIADITSKMEAFKKMYSNPLYNMAMTLIEPLPVGVVFALVSAGVLSRRRPLDQAGAA